MGESWTIFLLSKIQLILLFLAKNSIIFLLTFCLKKKNEAKPNGICHHHFTSDNKIIRTYTQIVHNMLDFTLLTYTKGLGVMLTENCEKCYFHELYQNLLKHLSDQIHQLISKFVVELWRLKMFFNVFYQNSRTTNLEIRWNKYL